MAFQFRHRLASRRIAHPEKLVIIARQSHAVLENHIAGRQSFYKESLSRSNFSVWYAIVQTGVHCARTRSHATGIVVQSIIGRIVITCRYWGIVCPQINSSINQRHVGDV